MFKRRKMKLRKGPLPFRYVMFISFFLFIVLTVQGLWIVNKGIEPTLMQMAEKKTEEIAALAISEAIINEITTSSEMEQILKYKTDNDGNVVFAGVNPKIVNEVATQAQYVVQQYLKDIEQGNASKVLQSEEAKGLNIMKDPGVIMEIPLGQATKNSLLANLGPKIPIKFTVIGEANTKIDEKIENIGINNTWISINIIVTVKTQVVIPFATKTAEVTRPIQIMGQFIPGEVPIYYNQSGDPIQPTIPIDPDIQKKESKNEGKPSSKSKSGESNKETTKTTSHE